jgi:acyl-ACP thioesterase
MEFLRQQHQERKEPFKARVEYQKTTASTKKITIQSERAKGSVLF